MERERTVVSAQLIETSRGPRGGWRRGSENRDRGEGDGQVEQSWVRTGGGGMSPRRSNMEGRWWLKSIPFMPGSFKCSFAYAFSACSMSRPDTVWKIIAVGGYWK